MKATEDAIKLGVKTAEEQAFLIKLLDVLEKVY
jgi:hypothetical protein